MTLIALATYEKRIASLFETSSNLILLDDTITDLEKANIISVAEQLPKIKIDLLQEYNVSVLVCGAICGNLLYTIEDKGIKVFSWITGETELIWQAYRQKRLSEKTFQMPGCFRKRRRGRGRKRR